MLTRKQFFTITLFFLVWRSILFGIGALAEYLLPYQPSFPYYDSVLVRYDLPKWVYSWANFDGVHYITIGEYGYEGTGLIQAFFPMFPFVLLNGGKMLLEGNVSVMALGLLLANVFAWGVFLVWFGLTQKLHNERFAWWSLLVLACFPTSFFLGALYTESLFLLLTLAIFYLALEKKWLWAGTLTMLATATRLVGIFLVPALLIELWQDKEQRRVENILPILFGSVGLLSYMFFLNHTFGDPLFFFHVQTSFGAGRQQTVILYPQVLWRSIKILLTNNPTQLRYLSYVQEFAAGFLGLVGLLLSFRVTRLAYVVFALGAFILPTMTGTFSSMSRYILVCFPLFLLITQIVHKRPKLGIVWLGLSLILLIINTVLFIQGYWVA